ncbi:MAG TPA: two-component regulator propeller domain-containing protein [Paludibacter sp.]|nr:two-component regulator propeller domain-containing protein [Paludibacter sp.]
MKFYSINSLYGISLRETSSLCSDKDGFIWGSSKTGIIRLTNDDYRLYQLPCKTTDYNTTKLIYHKTGLIAYTNNGQLFRYNRIYDRFDFIADLRKSANLLSINNLLVDKKGAFWISTTVGLYKFHNGVLTLESQDNSSVHYSAWFSDHQLIVAGTSGLWLWDTNYPYKNTPIIRENLSAFQISKLYYDQAKRKLWIGTLSNGFFALNFRDKILLRINSLPQQPILAIEANSDSTLLVGIDGQGVWEMNKETEKINNIYKEDADDALSLRGDGVYDIFCDQNNRVWVGTYSGGISFFNQSSPLIKQITHRVNNANSLGNNYINKIIEDTNGNIWFATNNGISRWDVRNDSWTTYYRNKKEQAQVFISLSEDNKGRIWAGTYSSGIYVIDGKSGREVSHFFQNDHISALSTNFVLDLFKDSQGNMWIGGVPNDVVAYMANENRFRPFAGRPINSFVELNQKQMLLVCTYGLYVLNKQTGEEKALIEGCWANDAALVDGNVWVCTRGEGLVSINLRTKKTERYTTKSGLPSNYINSVIKIGENLWLGTENGLCKFNTKSKTVLTYASLLSVSKVSFNLCSHCKLKNGNIIWGTNNGAVLFNPNDVKDSKTTGNIFFQDLTISGQSIRDGFMDLKTPLDSLEGITLGYEQNTINLELLPIGISSSDSKFSWKMEGLDKEWSQPSSQRIITYTNLPSGKLVLKIRLYDSSMSHVVSERTFSIHIIPPFWESWWFLLLMFVTIASIVYLSLKYYINHLKQLHTEEKVRFFTNTAHDIRTSLTLINAPIEELRKETKLSDIGKYYLNLATQQAKRLSTVVTQLMDFQKADIGKEQMSLRMVDVVKVVSLQKNMFDSFASSKNIEIVFNSNEPSYFTAIDEIMMEKVVGNLISNAIKYSYNNTQIYINLQCKPESWMLEVTDQGIGISRHAQQQLFNEFYRGDNAINSKVIGSGIGLLLVKRYVEMHEGKISCESQEEAGACFRVTIPYKKQSAELDVIEANFGKPGVSNTNEIASSDPTVPANNSKPKDIRILIVEDNDDLRNFMMLTLSNEFEIVIAEDGAKGWETIQKEMPDLVVSDVMMPFMDGFRLCELMKSTYETSHIPLILLTALSEKTEQLHGLGLGADDYLTKPFDMTLLVQRIKSVIRNRILIREKALKLIKENNNEPILSNENNDKFVKKALEVVRKNIADTGFGKDEFASAMNVSSSLLYKKIKSLTDQSPVDFIKTIRLNHALELLQSKKHSVTEISEMCGFASIGYFSTVFRKFYGKSPSELE